LYAVAPVEFFFFSLIPVIVIGARPLIKVHVDEKQVRNVVNGVEKMETKKWTFYEMGGMIRILSDRH
jgi:hypothetical protein